MITTGSKIRLVLNHGAVTPLAIETIRSKELDKDGYKCSYVFGGHSDELVFKGGKLHKVEFYVVFAR